MSLSYELRSKVLIILLDGIRTQDLVSGVGVALSFSRVLPLHYWSLHWNGFFNQYIPKSLRSIIGLVGPCHGSAPIKKSGIREVRQSGDPPDSLVSSENFPPAVYWPATRLLKTPALAIDPIEGTARTGLFTCVFLHRPEATSLVSQLIAPVYRVFCIDVFLIV